ncbi:MAG TPA: AmmeMemoRadiSam system protein B [Syntrophorhabdaceae bacterium]|nr:AmmeMemoRadiSam system protein B [Syntrophorhabdaceae bacterium]HPP05751.1 AmmeMemoRadiSam system protein B [Syntrophorhabdaceae bacterium]
MDKPQIRYIDAHPFEKEGQQLFIVSDPEGIMEESLVITRDVAFIISMMDGRHTLRDIQAEYMRVFGQLIYMEDLEGIVDTLDKKYLLYNDRYRAYLETLKEAYEKEKIRPAHLAGKSYPANRMDLIMYLDSVFKSDGKPEFAHDIVGIMAPHIDYSRGMEVYKEIYRYLKLVKKPLVVVIGVSHRPTDKIISISFKDFETPLDICKNSEALKGLIKDSILKEYIDEWPHRTEHSIELQLPLLQFVMEEDFEILPILTGSMHEYIKGNKPFPDSKIDEITVAINRILNDYGRPYIIVSGVDLAHIGAQFGDRYPLDALTLSQSKVKDEEILDAISSVDADRFFNIVKEERDRRRICGLTAIYLQLKLLKGHRCEIKAYKQWHDGASSVSFAGALFYR